MPRLAEYAVKLTVSAIYGRIKKCFTVALVQMFVIKYDCY